MPAIMHLRALATDMNAFAGTHWLLDSSASLR